MIPRTPSLRYRIFPAIARAAAALLAGAGLSTQAFGFGEKIEYNRDVRPILSEYCFRCHGPDSASRKAELRLDRREDAVKAGAIAPSKTDESELIARIGSTDPEEVMPPPATKKTLTDAQRRTLAAWIAQGAEYQQHWSLIPPQRPEPPKVKDAAWVRNPIDRFVLAKLEEAGLKPAPEADRRAIARRLALDLTGLPPRPEDVEAFVNDTDVTAYEKYVDKLMSMPSWGEHRARYWLDAARYADTNGIHFDNYREIWTYRDWVIRAFNTNMAFDKFTLEQLAGDLLPNATLDQRIASGFNRCNMTTNEGGAIDEEYLVLYTRDRTEATAQVWLGLTAGCAVCHDHKFDPLSQREFYSLAAFFNNTTQRAMDGNIKDTPPILFVPVEADRKRFAELGSAIERAGGAIEERKHSARAEFDMWLAGIKPETIAPKPGDDSLALHVPLNEGSGSSVQVTQGKETKTLDLSAGLSWKPGKLFASALEVKPGVNLELAAAGDRERDQAFTISAWVRTPNAQTSGAILARMDDQHDFRGWDLWIEGGKVGSHIISKWQDDALKAVAKQPVKANEWTHVCVGYDGSSKAEGIKVYYDGKPMPTDITANSLKNSIKTSVPLKLAQRNTSSRIEDLQVQDVRLYNRTLSDSEIFSLGAGARLAAIAAKPAGERTQAEIGEVFAYWISSLDPVTRRLTGELAALKGEDAAIRARGGVAHVMQEKTEPAMAYVLFRGDYDKRRDPVKPATPAVLPPFPDDLPRNRLGLAQWILRPDQPLVARVTVNRFWQEVFGTGLVKTTGDFGISGELPSHPELLDWLAVEFRESGWDVKRLFKLIVGSATYRQSAKATPEKIDRDPANRLLSHGPRFRMDAEMVRDHALAASSLLVAKIGGPSVKPYQPDGVWEAVAMIGSNTRDYKRDSGENLYRRSMYTLWKRAAPPASMEIFNAPSRELCTVKRERTDTPLQALVTLNDPQFVEAQRRLAELALTLPGTEAPDDTRLDFVAKRLLARPFHSNELAIVKASLNQFKTYYREHINDAKALISTGESAPDSKLDAADLAAWTMLVNELSNLDEVINK